jgi:hypothetical protein
MKVSSLLIYRYYVAISKDGKRYNISDWLTTGLWEAKRELEKKYGVVTSQTTIYNRAKSKSAKAFPINKFGYLKNKAELMAYANWVLFFPTDEREEFFTNEINKERFYKNNPIVDIQICVSLESVDTDIQYKIIQQS